MVRMTVSVSRDDLRQTLKSQLDQLDQIDEVLRKYGIDYPLGAQGVIDMHSQLAGQLEETQTELNEALRQVGNLVAEQNQARGYTKELEDAVLAISELLKERGATGASVDLVLLLTSKIEDDREKERQGVANQAGRLIQ
jgi:hypothetical protein